MTTQYDKPKRWKFSTRELLLTILIVGLSIGWWLDHRTSLKQLGQLKVETLRQQNIAEEAVAVARHQQQAQHQLEELSLEQSRLRKAIIAQAVAAMKDASTLDEQLRILHQFELEHPNPDSNPLKRAVMDL